MSKIMSVMTLLLMAPTVAAFVAVPLARPACSLSAPARASPTTAVLDLPPEEVAKLFDSGDAAAGVADAAGMHPLLDAAIFLITLNVAISFFGGFGDGLADEDDPDKLELASSRKETEFGWLQADLRMPLPSWKELQDACHLVGSFRGKYMYLCASSEPSDYDGCAVSKDFSEYYGNTVYVCQGKEVAERRTA